MSMTNPHSHHVEADGLEDEDAYRRGFQQGSEATLRAVERGATGPRLKRWRAAIYRWRFQTTHKKRIEPPTINPEEKA
jgi:hypothetical protein